jgi:hypothetical protein
MSYYGTTQLSSLANPPKLLVGQFAGAPAGGSGSSGLTTQGSTVAGAGNGSGSVQGAQLWMYCSTNSSTDITGSNFFSDGYYAGMRAGDVVIGTFFSSAGSTVTSFLGAIVSVSTSGASLSTGSLMTSTFN